MLRFCDVDGQDYSMLKYVWLHVYAYFHLVCLVSWIVVASCTLTLLWYHISNSVCPWVSYSWSCYPCVLPKTIRWPKLSHASCDSVLIGRKPSLQILILQILVQSRFDSLVKYALVKYIFVFAGYINIPLTSSQQLWRFLTLSFHH